MNRIDGSSSISAVIAALNEREDISPTLEELHKVSNDPHLIVLDRISVDATVFSAMKAEVRDLPHDSRGDDLLQCTNRLNSDAQPLLVNVNWQTKG